MSANLGNSAVATGLEKVSFHSNPKERQCQRMFKLLHNCTQLMPKQSDAQNSPSQASTYVNHEIPDVQAGFRKGSGTRDQIANICWIIKKAGEFQKNNYFSFIDYAKTLTVWIIKKKLWKILQETGIPDHLTCLPRNLYSSQEAIVRIELGTIDWFQIRKEVCQGYILSPCLFKLCAEYIMWNAGLD